MRCRSNRPPVSGARILAAVVVIWLSVGSATSGAGAQEDHYPLTVGVATCPTTPQQAGMPGQNCRVIPGITLEVRSDPIGAANGEMVGTCVTGAAADATCSVPVPYEQDFYVYVAAHDQDTTLAGYAPSPSAYPMYVPSTPAGVEPYPAGYIIFLPTSQAAAATPSAELPSDELSLTVSLFTCPSAMAAETNPDSCTPASEGFSFEVVSLEGVAPPANQADATRVADAYVFDSATLLGRGLYRNLAVVVTDHPEELSGFLATGKGVTCGTQFDFIQFMLPLGGPSAAISIYTFPPLTATPVAGATPSSVSTPASIDTAGDGESVCTGTFGD